MKIPDRSAVLGRAAASAVMLILCFAAAVPPAAAQNPFEALFGGPRYTRPQPPPVSAYVDPRGFPERESRPFFHDFGRREPSARYSGGGTVFCVRTCDGRFFPLPRHAGVPAAEQCRSFCPASKTMVFSGGAIERAVARNGLRYSELKTAFVYRDRVVENCTCNGRDGLGLARQNVMSDPTLRPGDIVATNRGFVSYRGGKSRTAQFTPIDPSSSAWARRLSEIRITPAPEGAVEPPPQEEAAAAVRKELRAQLDR